MAIEEKSRLPGELALPGDLSVHGVLENNMQSVPFLAKCALAIATCVSGWSFASDVAPVDGFAGSLGAQSVAAAPMDVKPVSSAIPGFGMPVESAALDGFRGGFELVKNDMQLSGTVANNSTVNVASGNNLVSDGSFTNANGLPMVIQNSGSNVLIQNATIFNVQFK